MYKVGLNPSDHASLVSPYSIHPCAPNMATPDMYICLHKVLPTCLCKYLYKYISMYKTQKYITMSCYTSPPFHFAKKKTRLSWSDGPISVLVLTPNRL